MSEAYASGDVGWRALARIAFELAPMDIVGKKEAAAILGRHPNNLRRDFPDLPDPEQVLSATPVWRREVIERYAAERAARTEG